MDGDYVENTVILHKVYGYVSEETFYEMLKEAKMENLFVDEKGRVDIGKLVNLLVTTFAEGRYFVTKHRGEILKAHVEATPATENAIIETLRTEPVATKTKSKKKASTIPAVDANPNPSSTDASGIPSAVEVQ